MIHEMQMVTKYMKKQASGLTVSEWHTRAESSVTHEPAPRPRWRSQNSPHRKQDQEEQSAQQDCPRARGGAGRKAHGTGPRGLVALHGDVFRRKMIGEARKRTAPGALLTRGRDVTTAGTVCSSIYESTRLATGAWLLD